MEPGKSNGFDEDAVLNLKDLKKKLIIDEFDEMLSLGFRRQLEDIFTMMRSADRTFFFSATMTDDVDAMLDEYFQKSTEISLVRSGTPLEK